MNKQDQKVIDHAIAILDRELTNNQITFTNPTKVKEYLTLKLSQKLSEVFSVVLLNNQHQVIEYREMFFGTVNASSVHPREIIRACIETNAAAIIVSHNHPSGIAEPSISDIDITQTIKQACALIDVRLLDHIIVAGVNTVSLAERGQI